jgi:hypothetical protein
MRLSLPLAFALVLASAGAALASPRANFDSTHAPFWGGRTVTPMQTIPLHIPQPAPAWTPAPVWTDDGGNHSYSTPAPVWTDGGGNHSHSNPEPVVSGYYITVYGAYDGLPVSSYFVPYSYVPYHGYYGYDYGFGYFDGGGGDSGGAGAGAGDGGSGPGCSGGDAGGAAGCSGGGSF